MPGWGEVFMLVLPLSTLPRVGAVWVLSPPPPLPAQLLLLPCIPGLWAKLLLRTGSSSRWEGLPTTPCESPSQASRRSLGGLQ